MQKRFVQVCKKHRPGTCHVPGERGSRVYGFLHQSCGGSNSSADQHQQLCRSASLHCTSWKPWVEAKATADALHETEAGKASTNMHMCPLPSVIS